MLLSGLQGTVIMKDGAKLDKAKVEAALTDGGLGLVSFSEKELPMPTSITRLEASGIG